MKDSCGARNGTVSKPRYYIRQTTLPGNWVVYDTVLQKVALVYGTNLPAAYDRPRLWWPVAAFHGIRLAQNPNMPLAWALNEMTKRKYGVWIGCCE